MGKTLIKIPVPDPQDEEAEVERCKFLNGSTDCKVVDEDGKRVIHCIVEEDD